MSSTRFESLKMSSGDVKKVSLRDIQVVQHLIERCLQLYMSQKEVVGTLLRQAKIEPGFTELIWQNLEKQNQQFFEAYHLRLVLKDQILEFNQLLEKQAELMRQAAGVASIPISNGSQISPMHQNTDCYAPEQTGTAMKPEYMHHSIGSSLPAFTNGGSSLYPSMQTSIDMSAQARRIDVPPHLLSTQSSNMGMITGMNGGIMKPETGFAGPSPFVFGANGNVLEMRPAVGNPSVSSLSGIGLNSQTPNETTLDVDTSSFGFLGQIPRNFSLSDLTANFSSSDILESYSRSPFLATDMDNLLDPHGRGEY